MNKIVHAFEILQSNRRERQNLPTIDMQILLIQSGKAEMASMKVTMSLDSNVNVRKWNAE